MDTKLKIISNIRIKRTVAAVLAVVFFFAGGFSLCSYIRDAVFYNRNTATGDYPGFERTNVFRILLNSFEWSLVADGEVLSCDNLEDYYKTSEGAGLKAAIEEKSENIKEACDYLDSVEGLYVYVSRDNYYRYSYTVNDGSTVYFTYDGGFISAEEFNAYKYVNHFKAGSVPAAADDSSEGKKNGGTEKSKEVKSTEAETATFTAPEDVSIPDNENFTSISGQNITLEDVSIPDNENFTEIAHDYYEDSDEEYVYNEITEKICEALRVIWDTTLEGSKRGLNYGEMTTDKLIEAFQKNASPESVDEIKDRGNEWIYWMEQMPSVKYAVFYKTSKNVITNCDVKYKDDTETVLSKIGKTYYEYTADGEYVCASETAECSFSDVVDFPGSALENAGTMANIDRIYVGWEATEDSHDPMNISLNAYKGNIKSHAKIGSESTFLIIAIISLILAVAFSVFTIYSSGLNEDRTVKIRFTDRIPLAIRLFLSGMIMAGCAVAVGGIHYYEMNIDELFRYNSFPQAVANGIANSANQICAVLITLFCAVFLALICSCARNIRNRTFFKHTILSLVLRFVRFIFRVIKSLFSSVRTKITGIFSDDYINGTGRKFLIFALAGTGALTLLGIILFAAAEKGGVRLFGGMVVLAVGAYAALLTVSFHRIASGISKMKEGKFDTIIEKKFMPPFMRAVAEELSGARDGVQVAVRQAMKDQATKTELLTNVTHDLKTPLTSIITYVDLLKNTDNPDEQAEYLEVLDEKSQRLKKLIDDLVQASKAASGNVEVNLMKLNLCEFAAQIIGENEDELADQGITIISRIPSEPVYVRADSNVTNRIFENLLSNIKKYALTGTRAYVEVLDDGDSGIIVFKNISSSVLDSDTEKFTERFYRGDASRTGEGNGLGLSIASNLCMAQGGTFTIETDGDLFKAIVTVPKASE